MRKRKAHSITVVALTLTLAACQHAGQADAAPEVMPLTAENSAFEAQVARVREALEAAQPESPIPELTQVSTDDLAVTEMGGEALAWGQGAAAETGIPETTYTLYRRYRAQGERRPYEGPYFAKRTLLTQEVVAAWLSSDDERIDRIFDLIWSVCEETTWVLPAHEREPWRIDLFSAETGAELATMVTLLGDRLPAEVVARVREEVRERILDMYLEHGRAYGWNEGRNNWTGVCAGAVGQAFLLLEEDVDRQAQAIALVLEQLERFLLNGFEEDGVCLEGIGYWNYGLSQCISFAEMLRVRTGDAIDLLAHEKFAAIAAYPASIALGQGRCASFSDSGDRASIHPFIAARLAQRTGNETLRAFAGSGRDWRTNTVLRNVLWWEGKRGEAPPLEDVILAGSGIARLVTQLDGRQLALAIKAGSNGEPHNHNDVGSFVVCVDGTIYLCDPGGGLYSRDYFSSKRYENVFANSYGHSVPRIGGALQEEGAKHRGTLESVGEKTVRLALEGAYEVAGLRGVTRTVSVGMEGVALTDTFEFEGAGLAVEEALMTWHPVAVEGGAARISTDKGTLTLRTDGGKWRTESLAEACKANRKSPTLTRITLDCPAAPKTTVTITMTFERV